MTLPPEAVRRIDAVTEEIRERVVAWRRLLHRRPELGMQERATAALVRETLQEAGLTPDAPRMETDVVALLPGSDGALEPNVTLRADMDALPLQEESGVPHASQTAGVMHACGHDGHTAALLGTALALAACRDLLRGSVRFVFQPAEELISGGRRLVADGVLRNPRAKAVLALHGWPGLPVGCLAACPGPMMAAAEFFSLHLKGSGGHASKPHLARDSLAAGAHLVHTLPAILKQGMDPLEPHVITVCHFAAGSNSNVIPSSAKIEGTLRYLDREAGARLRELLEKAVDACCRPQGIEYRLDYSQSVHPVVNRAEFVDLGRSVAVQLGGPDAWREVERPSLGGEDFCFFLDEAPGAMFRLGMGLDSAPLHSSTFDFHDEALGHAVRFLCGMVLALQPSAS